MRPRCREIRSGAELREFNEACDAWRSDVPEPDWEEAKRKRGQARAFVADALRRHDRLVTSAEVLQELLHYYLRTRRFCALDDAWALVDRCVDQVWSMDRADVEMARTLMGQHPGLEARDLVHLACCLRRKAHNLVTFDRGLEAAWRVRRR